MCAFYVSLIFLTGKSPLAALLDAVQQETTASPSSTHSSAAAPLPSSTASQHKSATPKTVSSSSSSTANNEPAGGKPVLFPPSTGSHPAEKIFSILLVSGMSVTRQSLLRACVTRGMKVRRDILALLPATSSSSSATASPSSSSPQAGDVTASFSESRLFPLSGLLELSELGRAVAADDVVAVRALLRQGFARALDYYSEEADRERMLKEMGQEMGQTTSSNTADATAAGVAEGLDTGDTATNDASSSASLSMTSEPSSSPASSSHAHPTLWAAAKARMDLSRLINHAYLSLPLSVIALLNASSTVLGVLLEAGADPLVLVNQRNVLVRAFLPPSPQPLIFSSPHASLPSSGVSSVLLDDADAKRGLEQRVKRSDEQVSLLQLAIITGKAKVSNRVLARSNMLTPFSTACNFASL